MTSPGRDASSRNTAGRAVANTSSGAAGRESRRRRIVPLLALVTVIGVAAGLVSLRGQGAGAPILLVTNSAAPNPFGPYLAEILRAEGIHAFNIAQLSTVTQTSLQGVRLVVLAETPLTAAQATIFNGYVAGGGRLVAMRPDSQIAALFNLTPLGSTTTNGYLAINQGSSIGAGLESATLPVRGTTTHYTPGTGVTTVATLYSDRTTSTGLPAVTRYNNTAAFAFDLARAIANARQGDPANINVDSGVPPLQAFDMFYTGFDAQRIAIPYADIEMRLFSRIVTDLLADALPLPRLWYFPSARRAMVLVAGDSHTFDQGAHNALINNAETFGARVTLYMSRWLPYPTSTVAAQWRSRGHELAIHPTGYQDNVNLTQAFQNGLNYFAQAGWGTPSRTVRSHQLEWLGWVDAAQIAAGFNMGLDINHYSFGPATQLPGGSYGQGYITGSGLPMRFVTQTGTIVPVYSLTTVLIDHQLFGITIWSDSLTTAQALTVSRGIIDQAVANYHTVIPTQFHVDYYTWGNIQPWADGTMSHAQANNVPMWTAERWLNYTEARTATTITNVTWVAGANSLQFTATVPTGAEPQTLMVPAVYNSSPIAAVQVNGTAATITTQTINGRSMAMFSVAPVAGGAPVVVNYGAAVPSISVNDVTVAEGTGGTNNAVFTVTLSTSTTQTVTVNYATANGTAVAPGDYTSSSGTLTFTPGATSRTVSVPIVTDSLSEPDETFTLNLTTPTNATIARATGTATLINDDGALPVLTINNNSGNEGNTGSSTINLTVSLTPASTQTVTVNWATSNVTALAGADYTAGSGTLTFNPGTTSLQLPLTILGDLLDELDETFTVGLSSPNNATIGVATGTVTIIDDDPTPTLSINDVTVNEGSGGTTLATFVVTLSAASGRTVTVAYNSVNGTAVAPSDFTAVSGTLTFNPGVTSQNVPVTIVTDTFVEPDETFTVVLSAPSNATLVRATGLGTIVNDDAAGGPATLTFQVASAGDDVNETDALEGSGPTVWLGNGNPSTPSFAGLRFTGVGLPQGSTISSARLEVNAPSTQWAGIGFEFAIEAAANSQPFTATSRPSQRTLLAPRVAHVSNAQWVAGTWYALDDLTPIVQALVNQPAWNAGNALSLIITGTNGAWARKFARAFEDAPATAPRLVVSYIPSGFPTLSINDVSVTEGTGAGTTTATFTVTLSTASASPVTFNFATSDGSATAPADYTATSGSRTIPAGQLSTTIPVTIARDSSFEPNETFNVTLSSPANATFARAVGIGTIVDDDAGSGPLTLTLQIASGANDVNQNTGFEDTATSLWLGNASPSSTSFTGLRFTGGAIPAGATITSARLEVNAATTGWISFNFEFGIEAALNSQAFTAANGPAQRTLLAPRVAHASNEQWVANTWYTLDQIAPIVQALVNQPGWASGNAFSLVIRGTNGAWARKWIRAFEDTPALAPRLVVTFIAP